jgi:hypothetical protein
MVGMEMMIGRTVTPLNFSRTMGSIRRRDDKSRGKVQSVREDSSAVGHARSAPPDSSNVDAIRATLESVVPAHNDLWFQYVLENRTDSEYRVADESEVKIFGRSRSTGALDRKLAEQVSGEFPLVVPARGRVHFALIWTGNHEIDPALVGDVVSRLALLSFVIIDNVRQYRIELPLRR